MSKKSIRIISTLLTIAIVLMVLTTTSFATISKPSQVNTSKTPNGMNAVEEAGQSLIGAIRVVGILLSVGILMVLGIKYMVGSAEDKSSYKKSMMPYLIGALLLFGASTLAGAVFDFAENL